MFIHRVICKGSDKSENVSDLVFMVETVDISEFDKMLTLKLIKPYKLFLLKRVMIDWK